MTTEPNIAPAAAATVTHGVLHNPGYAGPVPGPAAASDPAVPWSAADGHNSLLQDVVDKRLTYEEADIESKRMKWGDLPPLATWQEAQRAKSAPSPVAPDLRAQVRDMLRAHKQIQARKQDPEFVRKLTAGNVEAQDEWTRLHQQASLGEQTDDVTRAIELREAMAARQPAADADGYQPAAEHEIVIPKLVDVQAEAVARGEAQGGDAELIGAVQRAQSMLAAAEFCKETAGAIAADFAHDEPTLRAMDDTAWQLHENSVHAQMERRWGDRAGDMLGLARLVAEAANERHPGVTAFLRSSGMGSHFQTLVRLAEHGQRLAQRSGRSIESLRNEFPKLFTS